MSTNKPPINPYLAIFAGVLAVSFSALFVRLSSAPPLITASYRLIFTFMLIAPYTLVYGRKELFFMKRRELLLAALSGVFLALHFATWFTSLKYTSIASSVVIVTLQPVFVVIGSWLLFREKITRLSAIGGLLALCGSFIIGAGDFRLGMDAFYGDLLALFAAILVSGYMIIGRKIRSSVSLSAYTFVVYGCSALTLVIISLLNSHSFAPYPSSDWLLFFALAAICTVGGHTIFNWVIKYVPASTVAVCILGESLGAIIWGAVFLREYPGLRQIAGGTVIFAGLYLFTAASRPKRDLDAG
ncbi:MAG: DMT family transporter [Geobacteraceae bacterium]|nr:DMT family transporter [Geobacteraceae bacterium]